MNTVVHFVLFPGFVFTAFAGLITSWVDRKLTARIQMRKGPPLLQPFYDVTKLCVKDTCVPEGSPVWLFLTAPLIGLAGVTVASMLLWLAMLHPSSTFGGDVIVVMYLLAMPAVAVILGAFVSRNPLASLGGSREMKLVLAYELPFLLVMCIPIIHAGSLELGAILSSDAATNHFSGWLAILVAMVAMQARLTRVPFDIPEAESELGAGVLVEYSGPPLAIYRLTQAMMLFTMPTFVLVLLAGGLMPSFETLGSGLVSVALCLLKFGALIAMIVLIRNTTPRLRIDQAMRLLWGPVTLLAVAAVILAGWGW